MFQHFCCKFRCHAQHQWKMWKVFKSENWKHIVSYCFQVFKGPKDQLPSWPPGAGHFPWSQRCPAGTWPWGAAAGWWWVQGLGAPSFHVFGKAEGQKLLAKSCKCWQSHKNWNSDFLLPPNKFQCRMVSSSCVSCGVLRRGCYVCFISRLLHWILVVLHSPQILHHSVAGFLLQSSMFLWTIWSVILWGWLCWFGTESRFRPLILSRQGHKRNKRILI